MAKMPILKKSKMLEVGIPKLPQSGITMEEKITLYLYDMAVLGWFVSGKCSDSIKCIVVYCSVYISDCWVSKFKNSQRSI
jgi:hypothetical protein